MSAARLPIWLLPLAAADAGRRVFLRAFAPHVPRWFSHRDARVAWIAAFVVMTALLATAVAPLWLLALGPTAFGVPHLVADVRYLVVRRGLHLRRDVCIGVLAPVLCVAIHPDTRLGLLASAGAIVVARAPRAWKLIAFAVWGLAFAVAHVAGRVADIAFAHVHNLVALMLWWAWRPRSLQRHLPAIALFVLASAAILAGVTEAITRMSGGFTAAATALDWHELVMSLSPIADPVLGFRLVLWFAFAQSVHYGVWLRLIPEDDRARKAPRSFVSSFRALHLELGTMVLGLSCACALVIAAWGCADLAGARNGYLRLASFHGHLELAVATLMVLERTRHAGGSPPAYAGGQHRAHGAPESV